MESGRDDRQPQRLAVDVLEAKEIVLVDMQGRERASLACSGGENSHAVIHLYDEEGRPRITLQVNDRGNPSICLFNQQNSPCVSMSVNDRRGNGLTICDSEGKPCIMAGIPGPDSDDPRGPAPEITVVDELGHRMWTVFNGRSAAGDDQEDGAGEQTD